MENPEECSGGDLGLGGESSMGGAENYPDSIFVEAGRGTSGIWDGYLFTYASEQSQIEPNCFSTSRVCVNGTVGSDYEEFALVGWSIAQDIDPETHLGGNLHAISPGGTGVHVEVHNNLGSQLRVQIQADPSASEFWCAPVPFSGEGNIPWSDFHKECWTTGGEPYDGVTPIVQISVQVPSSGFEDSFDLCVVDISSY